MKTAVIILNYNGLELMKKFLPGVVAKSGTAQIVVADNGSTDGSTAWLKEVMPHVTLLEFDQNYGFAQGYNMAINAIKSDYVVLLNSDVEVTDHWLDPLEKALNLDDSIAACQPKLKSYRDHSKFEYAGACGGFIDKYGYPYCRGRVLSNVEMDRGQYDNPLPIFWATGACLMIRRNVYLETGGLDGQFFAHQEEIDLCWRLNARGYTTMCIPESVVYHVGGATLNEEHPHKTYLNFRNNALMLYKNVPSDQLFQVLALRFFLDYVAALQMLLQGKAANAVQVYKARKDYHAMKKEMQSARKDNLAKNVRKNLIGQLNHLLLWRVYIHKEKTFNQLPNTNEGYEMFSSK